MAAAASLPGKSLMELRLVNDHVSRIKAVYESLPPHCKPLMLQLTAAVPDQFMSDAIEQRMAFARIYSRMLVAKGQVEEWTKLVAAAGAANKAVGETAPIGDWCTAFETGL